MADQLVKLNTILMGSRKKLKPQKVNFDSIDIRYDTQFSSLNAIVTYLIKETDACGNEY